MKSFDDFPVTPSRTVDSQRFYEAFLRAQGMFDQVPESARGPNADRALHDLTLHLYDQQSKSGALFRATLGASDGVIGFWLSRVRSIAEWLLVSREVPELVPPSAEYLRQFALLSADIGGLSGLSERLLRSGIILVHQSAPSGARVDGCSFVLPTGHAVIGLSLRYARLDYYWFTLMHELSHLALHLDRLSTPIVDDLEESEETVVEQEANRLASDSLIPRNLWRNCQVKYSLALNDVVSFAEEVGVAPQIVAGRLRNELHRHELFSALVHEVNVRERILGHA